MNLKYYYWYFPKVLPKSFCNDLIKYGKTKKEEIGVTGKQDLKLEKGKKLNQEDVRDLKKKRNSNIVWLDDPWIYREIHPFIHKANQSANWNF